MDQNSHNNQGYKLESQIREAFGRVTYTLTTHNKKANKLIELDNKIKIFQIVLSAIITSGFVFTIFSNDKASSIVGALISLASLILNTYMKNYNLASTAQDHIVVANKLWKIREEYVSLLTDFDILNLEEIMHKRDELQNRTFHIYSSSPRTDMKSYLEAQKALKTEEEQTFSEDEIDIMLPSSIRRINKKNDNS